MQIAILGQNPHLSLAEIESLSGSQNVTVLNHQAALVNDSLDITKLGGTVKLAEPIKDVKDVKSALDFIANYYKTNPPEGKLNLGFSYYGANSPSDLYKQIMNLKKTLKSQGYSVRIVNQPKDKILNAAQIAYNGLNGAKGNEWLLVKKHGLVVVAKTTSIQDIDDFASRDRARPSRDAKIGMLPPKLALILVNIASQGKKDLQILDPFCGTGVVLQEAALLGHNVTGTDINPAMITASQHNLDWLAKDRDISVNSDVYIGDATTAEWHNIDAVACETYLGPPLSKPADRYFFDKNLREINQLHERFLQNIHGQLKSGARLVLALPAWWQPGPRFQRLPLVDHLRNLGYNRVDFASARRSLIYHREGQYVARDVVVIERI